MIEFEQIKGSEKEFVSTPANAMESVLRGAVTQLEGQERGMIFIPYMIQIEGQDSYLLIRSRKIEDESFFDHTLSLDVGRFSSDFRWFNSVGMLDFRIKERDGMSNIGYCGRLLHSFDPKEFFLQRTWDMEEAMDGFYVHESLRNQKIGSSLISGARIILNELGVEELMFNPAWSPIYEKMGAKIIKQNKSQYAALLPTAYAQEAPYIFE